MPIDCVQNHTVQIFDRGGTKPLHQLQQVSSIQWGRVRDDISTMSLTLNADSCSLQEAELAKIRSSRHEAVVFRGGERVWEGPITRLVGNRNSFGIYARDVMHYAARTTMRAAYNNAYPKVAYVIDRAKLILLSELARKEGIAPAINVVPHIVTHQKATDAKTASNTRKYQFQVWEHLDELAARGGLDYTVIGRAIHLWDVHEAAMGQTAVLTQNDFLGEISVTEYGMELATWSHVTDGQGGVGTAGANDPYYGEVEILATAYDEETDDTVPTSAELKSQASRNLDGRNPTPLQVRVPDNSTINPKGILRIQDLVPGIHMPVRAQVVGFDVTQMQKLDSVTVTETPKGEEIKVRLSPAAGTDIIE